MYNAINNNLDVLAGKYDLSTITACISGSAPLMYETKVKFEELTGGKLVEGYGLSESPTATHCNPIDGKNPPKWLPIGERYLVRIRGGKNIVRPPLDIDLAYGGEMGGQLCWIIARRSQLFDVYDLDFACIFVIT